MHFTVPVANIYNLIRNECFYLRLWLSKLWTFPLHFFVLKFFKVTLNKKNHFIVKYQLSKMEWVGFFFFKCVSEPSWPAVVLRCSDLSLHGGCAHAYLCSQRHNFFLNNEDTLDVSCMSTEQPKEFKYTFLYQKEVFQSPALFLWINI